jgi:hypothetical protein
MIYFDIKYFKIFNIKHMQQIIQDLHEFISTTPHIGGQFVVEAIFATAEQPEKGCSAVLAIYNTVEEAESVAKSLSLKFSHNFLTYRYRNLKIFHDFYDPQKTTLVLPTSPDQFEGMVREYINEYKQSLFVI